MIRFEGEEGLCSFNAEWTIANKTEDSQNDYEYPPDPRLPSAEMAQYDKAA